MKGPQALWARQLASQRTGFAIPAAGAIQSDLFPVLEYEAPKAFYIGASSALLTLFDERTWQRDLAMPEKEEALHSLEVDVLREVFGSFTSVNDQLNQCLAIRVEADANQDRKSTRLNSSH